MVFWFLSILIGIAFLFSIVGWLPYSPVGIVLSFLLILTVCYITNILFAWAFKAHTNVESVYITAFILVLIITPIKSPTDYSFLALAIWASIWAMASKYIFAIKKKHIFNPAAFGVAMTALFLGLSASWWVGTLVMAPFVLIGGLLVVRKILRFDVVVSFVVVAIVTIIGFSLARDNFSFDMLERVVTSTSLLFFASIMITEPLTTPPTKGLRIWYGAILGFLFAPYVNIAGVFSTPELALLTGNIFSYIVSPKKKLILKLEERRMVAKNTYDFVFKPDQKLNFKPGQYLEWTLSHEKPDNRGNRRYFTIASSPTEELLRMGVKFYPDTSSFKLKMLDMQKGDTIVASQLAGDFYLPKSDDQKLAFLAGGIGVTPFRSMIKYQIDTNEPRDITMIYANNTLEDIAYKELFDEAEQKVGIKTVYPLTFITQDLIKKEIPDYMGRKFYVSGPRVFVTSMEKLLHSMNIPQTHIKKDFFPGFV